MIILFLGGSPYHMAPHPLVSVFNFTLWSAIALFPYSIIAHLSSCTALKRVPEPTLCLYNASSTRQPEKSSHKIKCTRALLFSGSPHAFCLVSLRGQSCLQNLTFYSPSPLSLRSAALVLVVSDGVRRLALTWAH